MATNQELIQSLYQHLEAADPDARLKYPLPPEIDVLEAFELVHVRPVSWEQHFAQVRITEAGRHALEERTLEDLPDLA